MRKESLLYMNIHVLIVGLEYVQRYNPYNSYNSYNSYTYRSYNSYRSHNSYCTAHTTRTAHAETLDLHGLSLSFFFFRILLPFSSYSGFNNEKADTQSFHNTLFYHHYTYHNRGYHHLRQFTKTRPVNLQRLGRCASLPQVVAQPAVRLQPRPVL